MTEAWNVARGAQRQRLDTIMIFVVIFYVVLVAYELFRMWQTRQAILSKISVCNDAITGALITGTFGVSIKEIHLPYNTIVNVDVVKQQKVVVHAQHEQYTCYAKNADEIRSHIMALVNQARGATR